MEEPSCGPACDDGENLPEHHHHPVASGACKTEGLWSGRVVQQVPFGVGEDGGGSCCWEAERSLSVGEEEPVHFGGLDDVAAVEEVELLRMEENFRPEHQLVEVAAVAASVADSKLPAVVVVVVAGVDAVAEKLELN